MTPSYILVRAVVWAYGGGQQTDRQTDTQTTIHFASTTHAKCNNHYALISTDPDYTVLHRKLSVKPANDEYFKEWQIFPMLDRLRPTATGIDALPASFLINQSLACIASS